MARTTTPSLADEITELRGQRIEILDQLAALAASPVTLAEAELRVDAYLDAQESMARSWVNVSPLISASGGRLDLSPAHRQEPLGLQLIIGGRPTIKSALMAEVKTLIGGKGVDEAVRADKTGKLQAELAAVERAEERACRELEDSGAPVARRPDASMALVLAETV